jgi:hypothetical protein
MPTETYTADGDFTVPDGVFSLEVELEGEAAQSISSSQAVADSGDGGRVTGTFEINTGDIVAGDTLFIRSSPGGDSAGQDGGDSIDIRFGGTELTDRLAVAAGGGGGGVADSLANTSAGGAGGADTGESASADGGAGGTQTAGGAGGTNDVNGGDGLFGSGGDGATDANGGNGGGGGAGWYGGGGGASFINFQGDDGGWGGGGGSNYDDGLDSVTANERGTSTRSFGEGGLVTITYEQTPGAENLQITDTTATSNTLSWDAPTLPPEVDSVDQYRIYRATGPGTVRADYTEVGTTPTPGFEDTGLDNGIEYHYRIGADLVVN